MNSPVGFLAFNVPFFSIFLPLLAAIVTPLLPNRVEGIVRGRLPERLTCVVVAIVGALSVYLLAALSSGEGVSFTYAMGHFPAPWGNELRAGPLEALMALVFCASMLLSLLGNLSSTDEDVPRSRRPLFCSLLCLLLSSLLAMIYTNDLFTAYVFIEINTISACAIVAAKEGGETVRAALRYLVMSLVGSGLVLLSICLLYDLTGHLLMEPMRGAIQGLLSAHCYHFPLTVALGLMTVGLCIKSALYPFAFWLPDAHGSATNASSAILSGIVLKGYILLLIKVFCRVFGLETVGLLRLDGPILALGVLSMIVGSLHALRQTNVKRMIAWSSVAQMGYIFLGIGLNTAAGIAAACLHIIVHAAVKPMLFTAAGGLSAAAGHHKELRALRGTFYANRWAGLGLAVGAFSMMGIPAFAGFASKLALTLASFDSPAIAWALGSLAASSVLNALYYVPAVVVILTHPDPDAQPIPGLATPLYRWTMAAFLALNFFLGLFGVPTLHLIEKGVSLFG